MGTTSTKVMRGLRKLRDEPGLWLCDDIPCPTIGDQDVLVQVTHAGICGTDRHIYEWDRWSQNRIKIGITTGHEFVGHVVEVGKNCKRFKAGDRVSGEGHIFCGHCKQCRTGNAHVCQQVEIIGIDRNGCFANFLSIPEDNVWPVHPDIPDEVAAIFDPLGNAVHTVMSANVSGKTVLITGVGIIGLMAVSVAKAAGASRIFVSDVDDNRLAVARQLGADVVYNARDDWTTRIKTETDGYGTDVLLEMSGNETGIRQGFSSLAFGGTAAMLGIPGNDISIDLANDIIFRGATVLGINGRRIFETWYQMESLLLSGKVDLKEIITHVIDLADWESGIKMMQNGEAIKVVLKVS